MELYGKRQKKNRESNRIARKKVSKLKWWMLIMQLSSFKKSVRKHFKGGEGMAKNKNNQLKNNKNAQPNDQEFAGENGLEKVVRQAQKKPK